MNGAGLRQPGRVGCGRWTLPLGRFLLRDIRGPSAASGKVSSEKRAGPWADVPGGVLVKCVQNGLPLPWQEGLATPRSEPWSPLAKPLEVRVLFVGPGTAKTCSCRGRRDGHVFWQCHVKCGTNAHDSPITYMQDATHTRANDQEAHPIQADLHGPLTEFLSLTKLL